MFTELIASPYFLSSVVLVLLGLTLTITALIALIRARTGSFILQILLAISLLGIGGLTAMISLGIPGYKTLTREEVVANISVSPIAAQRFSATFRYPDGRVANYIIAGDEIYIDAHILKWQPIANLIGLHTAYELDRIGGRYRELEQERTAERTLHALSQDKPVNLFKLRQLHAFLSVLLDAKYGSATFVPVTQAAELELSVSTSGLLIRELHSGAATP